MVFVPIRMYFPRWMYPVFHFRPPLRYFEPFTRRSLIHMRNRCIKNADVALEIEPELQIFCVENQFFKKVGNLDFHPLKSISKWQWNTSSLKQT